MNIYEPMHLISMCLHVCLYDSVNICVYSRLHMYIFMFFYMLSSLCVRHMYIFMFLYIPTFVFVSHAYIHFHMHSHVCACVGMYVYVLMNLYGDMHVRLRIHMSVGTCV